MKERETEQDRARQGVRRSEGVARSAFRVGGAAGSVARMSVPRGEASCLLWPARGRVFRERPKWNAQRQLVALAGVRRFKKTGETQLEHKLPVPRPRHGHAGRRRVPARAGNMWGPERYGPPWGGPSVQSGRKTFFGPDLHYGPGRTRSRSPCAP